VVRKAYLLNCWKLEYLRKNDLDLRQKALDAGLSFVLLDKTKGMVLVSKGASEPEVLMTKLNKAVELSGERVCYNREMRASLILKHVTLYNQLNQNVK